MVIAPSSRCARTSCTDHRSHSEGVSHAGGSRPSRSSTSCRRSACTSSQMPERSVPIIAPHFQKRSGFYDRRSEAIGQVLMQVGWRNEHAERSDSSYNDGCASAHALDLIGERWTLIVVRELLLGPKRSQSCSATSPASLPPCCPSASGTSRGGASRHVAPSPPRPRWTSTSSRPGASASEAVNTALSTWAVASPDSFPGADMSPDTVVLAMRAHARPDEAATEAVACEPPSRRFPAGGGGAGRLLGPDELRAHGDREGARPSGRGGRGVRDDGGVEGADPRRREPLRPGRTPRRGERRRCRVALRATRLSTQ